MRKSPTELWKSLLLPVLGAVYPVVFLYYYNARITPLQSVTLPLAAMTALGLLLFALFWVVIRKPAQSALSALLFLAFFHSYGLVYNRLFTLNKVQVEHYTLLPLLVFFALYGAFFLSKLKKRHALRLQNLLLVVFGALLAYNVAATAPIEVAKAQSTVKKEPAPMGVAQSTYPDIYFLIFDEYAGFEALEEYWHYDGYRDFVTFLEDKGFFVAEKSRSHTSDTLYEMASRLNLKVYKKPDKITRTNYQALFAAIADNKVMRLMKSYGYSTVVFDGPAIPYKNKTEIIADYNLSYQETEGIGEDEFTSLFLRQTMVLPFPQLYTAPPGERNNNTSMILYTLEETPKLEHVPTPKFVYMHVMLPHLPITFDENGDYVHYKHKVDWSYYLAQHKYATKRAQLLVEEILRNADPQRPPVIILQSDHGARNNKEDSPDSVILQNYDDRHKTSILNAVLIPGLDTSQLPEDLSPMEPLKMVLNHYFNAGVEIEPADAAE